MPSISTYIGFTILNLAVLYQFVLRDVIFNSFGYGRVVQSLSDFPYTCRRITDHNVAACEDAWIDTDSRQIFLACSNALGRKAWNPNIQHLAAERRSQGDHIVAMSLDKPHPQDANSFDYRVLDLGDYTNVLGDPELNLVGMTGRSLPDGSINLYFINAQPTFDLATQLPKDQSLTGANATIEAFNLPSADATTLKHLHTFHNPTNISTPNNVALRPDGSIVLTNDHGSHTVGLGHTLSPILGTGNVAQCIPPTHPGTDAPCTLIATSQRYHFPNGLHISTRDNLLYIPSSVTGIIDVFASPWRYNSEDSASSTPLSTLRDASDLFDLTASAPLERVGRIELKMPLDNISEDADGNLLVAAFPKISQMEHHLKQSTPVDGTGSATTIWKVTRDVDAWEVNSKTGFWDEKQGKKRAWNVEKLLEDDVGRVLPGATTAVRDAKTGRVWVVGVVSPWIAVCEPN